MATKSKRISAEEFTQTWNVLCQLQTPNPDYINMKNATQILNDEEEEEFTDFETEINEERLSKSTNKYKQNKIHLCRHKLQERTYPRTRKLKTVPIQSEQLPDRENVESDYEWLQLLQMEKIIEKQKQDLLKASN